MEEVIKNREAYYASRGRRDFREQFKQSAFTEKQKYFFEALLNALKEVYKISQSILDQSLVWEIGKGLALTTGTAGVSFLANKFLNDDSWVGNLAGIGVSVAVGIYSVHCVSSLVDAKQKAQKTVSFFSVAENSDPAWLMSLVAYDLSRQFSLSIELLTKSDTGILKVVAFFAQRVILATLEESLDFSENLNTHLKVAHLKKKIFSDVSNIPSDEITTETKIGFFEFEKLQWKLNELIAHSPVLCCTSIGMDDKEGFRFTPYVNFSSRKTRWSPKMYPPSLYKEVSAEASHKYPVQLVFDESEIEFREGYIKQIPLSKEFFLKDSSDENQVTNHANTRQIQKIFDYSAVDFMNLYVHLRKARRSPEDKENFEATLQIFNLLASNYINCHLETKEAYFTLFFYIQNLLNLHRSVLQEVRETYTLTPENPITQIWERSQMHCGMLSTLYFDQEKITKLLEIDQFAEKFHKLLENIPSVSEEENYCFLTLDNKNF